MELGKYCNENSVRMIVEKFSEENFNKLGTFPELTIYEYKFNYKKLYFLEAILNEGSILDT